MATSQGECEQDFNALVQDLIRSTNVLRELSSFRDSDGLKLLFEMKCRLDAAQLALDALDKRLDEEFEYEETVLKLRLMAEQQLELVKQAATR